MTTRFQATVTASASPREVFALLTDPGRHSEFDATGMVGPPASSAMLTRVGQVFVMNMTYCQGDHVEHYQSDNDHVTALEPPSGRMGHSDSRRPLGWLWRYDVEPGADGCVIAV